MNPKIDPHEFEGRRFLVMGGTKGIGQAVSARLREGDATVLTTARNQPGDIADGILFIAADITTAQGARQWPRPFVSASAALTSSATLWVAHPRLLAGSPSSMITGGSALST